MRGIEEAGRDGEVDKREMGVVVRSWEDGKEIVLSNRRTHEPTATDTQ